MKRQQQEGAESSRIVINTESWIQMRTNQGPRQQLGGCTSHQEGKAIRWDIQGDMDDDGRNEGMGQGS